MKPVRWIARVVPLVLASVCAAIAGDPGAMSSTVSAERAEPHELVVFAAASLKEVFEKVAKDFEADHPGARVALQLAGSQELRTQIENGAQADVFASADSRHMSALRDQKLTRESAIFARNDVVVVVPAANPAGVARFGDLPKAKRLVVGVPEVPIGSYTLKVLANASKTLGEKFAKQVEDNIVSRELNVRQILAKVSLGEADAGFVYRTDAAAAGDRVRVVEIPTNWNVVAEYPIAVTTGSQSPELAEAWVKLVLSDRGQAVLRASGFRAGDASPGSK